MQPAIFTRIYPQTEFRPMRIGVWVGDGRKDMYSYYEMHSRVTQRKEPFDNGHEFSAAVHFEAVKLFVRENNLRNSWKGKMNVSSAGNGFVFTYVDTTQLILDW